MYNKLIQHWRVSTVQLYLLNSFTKKSNRFILCLVFLCFFSTQNTFAQTDYDLFDATYIHEIRINFSENDFWEILTNNYEDNIGNGGDAVPYISASTVIDGMSMDSVGIRQKGKSSYSRSNYYKKSIKIDFNEFVRGQKFMGYKKFNLHNGACDPAMMRDLLGFDMMRRAGVKAPRYAYCKLYLNDEFWGVYGIIEQIDDVFVKDHFADGSGNLFKNGGWSNMEWLGDTIANYKEDFELKTNEEEDDWTGFLHLTDVINNYPDAAFPTAIQEIFNVDAYLHVLAIDVLTNNWDSYIQNRRNWYLYEDPTSGKFNWIPWDYNLAMGGDFSRTANPYQPIDTTCGLKSDFVWLQEGLNFSFEDQSDSNPTSWAWSFGDGTTSTERNPQHEFSSIGGETRVCLTTEMQINNHTCEHTRCQVIDLSYNPSDCNTISNGTSPHPANDPVYQEVTADDDYCCNGIWDAVCEVAYQDILLEQQENNQEAEDFSIHYDRDFQIIQDNPEKPLIYRLMQVPEFRQRYLDIVCSIMEHNFTKERLFPMIDFYADLIRTDIHDEPNYIFHIDYFEYDTGDGTGGGDDATIPALKKFFNDRIPQVQADLADLEMDCSTVINSVAWHDLVINEFMASNDDLSGITDPAGEAEDWVEIHNNTDADISLDGIYLSDDPLVPLQWAFPLGTVIEAQGYLIVWADKDEDQEGLHSNFKLSKSGETLTLIHENSTVLDSLTFGEQTSNISSARMPNGTGDFLEQHATFNQNNETVSTISSLEILNQIHVYPNPTQDYLHLNIEGQMDKEALDLELKDALGRTLLKQENIQYFPFKLQLKDYQRGIYFLEIHSKPGKIVKKIILN